MKNQSRLPNVSCSALISDGRRAAMGLELNFTPANVQDPGIRQE
jgi:hypothetical protein